MYNYAFNLTLALKVLFPDVKSLFNLLIHGVVPQDNVTLGKIGYTHAFGAHNGAAVLLHEAGNNLHEGGLTLPVAACKGRTGMLAQCKTDVVEKIPVPERQAYVAHL